jgi:hypothetical protein
MGRNAAFGRPARLDAVRQWWHAMGGPARVNTLVFMGVGVVAVALVVAATSRDGSRPNPLANAARPHLTSGGFVATTTTSFDLRSANGPGGPSEVVDPTTTTSTVAATPILPDAATSASPGASTAASTPGAAAPTTTVADPRVVPDEVPVDPSPTTTPAPVTTTAPATTSTTRAPVTTAPTTTRPAPTTTTTTTPPLLPLPPLLSGLG